MVYESLKYSTGNEIGYKILNRLPIGGTQTDIPSAIARVGGLPVNITL